MLKHMEDVGKQERDLTPERDARAVKQRSTPDAVTCGDARVGFDAPRHHPVKYGERGQYRCNRPVIVASLYPVHVVRPPPAVGDRRGDVTVDEVATRNCHQPTVAIYFTPPDVASMEYLRFPHPPRVVWSVARPAFNCGGPRARANPL